MIDLAPIVVSVYTRIEHFKKCIEALKNNDLASKSDLYIISDAAYRAEDVELVNSVRSYARTISGFKNCHLLFREKNLGGFESVVQAEKGILAKHKKIIFLEDDVIVSKSFLSFLNNGLEHLYSNKSIFSISAYCPPPATTNKFNNKALIAPFHCPWGYATWEDRYQFINPRFNPYKNVLNNKKIISYIVKHAPFMLEALRSDFFVDTGCADIRISFQMMLQGMMSVYPAASLARNIGFDGSGQRMGINEKLNQQEISDNYFVDSWDLIEDLSFIKNVVEHGMPDKRPLIIPALYQLGLRDPLDFVVAGARRLKRLIESKSKI